MSFDHVVDETTLLNQYWNNAAEYQTVVIPSSGIEIRDMDPGGIILPRCHSAMLQCITWLSFSWGTFSDLQIPRASAISLKQLTHGQGLGHHARRLRNIDLRLNYVNLKTTALPNGRQVLQVIATVYFSHQQGNALSPYILYLNIDASVKRNLLQWLRS